MRDCCSCSGQRESGSAPGGTVAVVYSDQDSMDRQTEIKALESRLEQLEFAQQASQTAEVALKLDNQIIESLLELREALASDRLDRAETAGATLRSLVLKRDYTYNENEDLSGQITELKGQISMLKTQAAGIPPSGSPPRKRGCTPRWWTATSRC